MKKHIIMASMALALAACSNQDEPMGGQLDTPVAAEFSAEIGEPISRAHDASWESGDAIGISGGTYNNVNYTVSSTSTGKFTPASGNGIFFQNTSNVTFSAYYPFGGTSGTARGTVSASTSDQSSSKTFDFLWAQTTANYQSPTVNFNFTHKMTRLILQLKTDANSGFSASDVSSGTYKLSGIKHSGTFNTSNGTATATGAATNDWTINATASTSDNVCTYSLIFFPQSGAKLTLTATLNGQDYACDFTPGLTAGTSYTYTITIKKNGLEVSNATITNWTTGTSGTGTATPTDPFNGHTAVLMREASETTPALYFADRNIGATSPEDVGLFFWWGDVVGHKADSGFNFASSNCPTYNKDLATLYSEGYMTNGTDWNTAALTAQYDAAQEQWQGPWRLPTKAEIEWLTNTSNCTREYVAASGDKPAGWKLTSKTTNNSIFIPFSGYITGTTLLNQTTYGYYWTSTIYNASETYVFRVSTSAPSCNRGAAFYRYLGYPLRPVATK